MPQKKLPKLLIFDGNALIHRSFHALPTTMRTSKGEVVNAVYGFTAFVLRAIKEFKPEMVAIAFDEKGKTFRNDTYDKYKANRVKAPDELYGQIPRAREVAEVLEIPVFRIAGCEADDVIGTIVRTVKDAEKIIVTGDMDTLQLVDDHTSVYTMSRGFADSILYDEKQVIERYGLKPDQIVEFKALRGDPSDNIPGVRGIGEKNAVELLQEFSTVKNLYKNLKSDKIKPRIKELLEAHRDDAFMSHDLATIRCDIQFPFDEKALKFGGFDRDRAEKLFIELEFKSLLPRLSQTGVVDKKATALLAGARTADKFARDEKEFNYTIIQTDKDFATFFKKLSAQKRFAFDTETSGLDNLSCDLLGMSFSWKNEEAYYLDIKQKSVSGVSNKKNDLFNWQGDGKDSSTLKNLHPWLIKLKPIMEKAAIKKIAHNGKFDMKILRQFGITVEGLDFDTMIAAYILNPGGRQYGIDALALERLAFEKISTSELIGTGKAAIEFPAVPLEKLGIYACEDADITWRLHAGLEKELVKEKLKKVFTELEIDLIPCLIDMELTGISLDTAYLKKLEKEIDADIASIQKKIWKCCGKEFNISSTKQLQTILFTDLEISTQGLSRTKTGISTGADELAKLKGRHEIIDWITEYRELTKLASTYVRTLPELVSPVTGRLHTNFNQTIAATGRLSSTDPNLQNIPIRTELGRKIRRAFVPKKGCELLSIDYSQLELRIAAHIADDPAMKKAFKNNEDIHTATAALINHVAIDKVTTDMRRQAKTINFGILYGQGPHGLAQTAEITYEEARKFIEEYFKAYKNIKKYVDTTIADAKDKGYVETLFGRKRYIPEINATNAMIRKSAERMAVNTPIQGTEADMIKKAMIQVHQLLNMEYTGKISMLLQVHDELLFEVEPDIITEVTPKITKIMENTIKLSVPIIADAKHGLDWETMKPV
jgi:DNA polymerase-1